jgi:hypothetical protein
MWPIMVAIGKAESGLRVDAVSPLNHNGTHDLGWLQISKHGSPSDYPKLTTDAVANAAAGLSIWQSQGLRAWSTYNNGAYAKFLPIGQQGAAAPADPPKGSSSGGGGVLGTVNDVAGTVLGVLSPGVGLVGGLVGAGGGIASTAESLASLAELGVKSAIWVANPHNWTRILEVIGGAAGALLALRMLASSGVGGPVGAVAGGLSKAENAAAKIAEQTGATKAAAAAAL